MAQQSDTKTVTVTAIVNAKAKLTVGPAGVSFADADPDVTPILPASADVTVDVKSRTTTNGAVTLTVQSGTNLTSGSDSIAIANLTWTAAGTGFAAGTMATSAVSLGAWTGGGTQSGTQSYLLANSWNYKTGTYGATITYTLTAP
jgi:hypothetical protein